MAEGSQPADGSPKMAYVNLDRTFRDLSEAEELGEISLEFRERWGLAGISWDELLKSRRVLLMAEAGAGKTQEFQAQCKRLVASGCAAFFMPIEALCNEPLRDYLRGEGLTDQYEHWTTQSDDPAWFFLDSVDELKLAKHSLSQALRALVAALGPKLRDRARFVISCRPADWRPLEDQASLDKYLPLAHSAPVATPDDDEFLDPIRAPSDESNAKTSSALDSRQVVMLPLSNRQQRKLVSANGISNVDDFFCELQQVDVGETERTPQDIVDLTELWRDTGRFGPRRAQLEHRVRTRLDEKNASPLYRGSLSDEKAIAGAQRLALALVLMRRRTIRLDAAIPVDVSMDNGVKCADVLSDWSPIDIEQLLHRAIFLPARYGHVRFDHRSSEEYLAAQRLLEMSTRQQMPKQSLLNLFFSDRYGEATVQPSLVPVAAWVALENADVRRELMVREPEKLVLYGDAATLPLEVREALVRAYVNFYGKSQRAFVSQSVGELRRLATNDMASVIRECFGSQFANPSPRNFLIKLIWLGGLSDCADLIAPVCFDTSSENYTRILCLRAAGATAASNTLKSIALAAAVDADSWPTELLAGVVEQCFPSHLTVEALETLVRRTGSANEGRENMQYALQNIGDEPTLTVEVSERLISSLTRLVLDGKSGPDRWSTVSKFDFVLPALLALCNRTFSAGRANATTVAAASVIFHFGEHFYSLEHEVKNALKVNIANASNELRASLFWFELDYALQFESDADSSILEWQVLANSPMDQLTKRDMPWLEAAVCCDNRPSIQRQTALRKYLRLWRENGEQKSALDWLGPATKDDSELQALLTDLLRPPSGEQREQWELQEARRKQKTEADAIKKTDAQRETEASWLKFRDELVANTALLFSAGKCASTLQTLMYWLRMQRTKGESSIALNNWSRVRHTFGDDVGTHFEDALRSCWRRTAPTLASLANPEDGHTISFNQQLALTGLLVEKEESTWPTTLSDDEVVRAAEWATVEVNSFPPWLNDVADAHLGTTTAAIAPELEAEITRCANEGYPNILSHVQVGPSALRAALAPMLMTIIQTWPTAKLERKNGNDYGLLSRCMQIVISSKYDLPRLNVLCQERHAADPTSEDGRVWLQGIAATDLSVACKRVRDTRAQLPENERQRFGIDTIAMLFGLRDSARISISLDVDVPTLVDLLTLAHECVPPALDPHHSGTYSPDNHDDAVRARGLILNALEKRRGAETHRALIDLSYQPLFEDHADYLRLLARQRSAEDSEHVVASEIEFNKWTSSFEFAPKNRDELFELVLARMQDVDNHLRHHDFSQRDLLALVTQESLIQRFFAMQFDDRKNGCYAVVREDEVVDRKKPDIRLAATTFSGLAAIEIKIADSWSAHELDIALEVQLAGQYLRDWRCSVGVLLVTYAGRKGFDNPENNKPLDFVALISRLRTRAAALQQASKGELRLDVFGIDLRPTAQLDA